MKIRVQFFSKLRAIGGSAVLEREVEEGATVALAFREIENEFPELKEWEGKLLLAVGTEFAQRDQPLADGELLSIMPPVQGG